MSAPPRRRVLAAITAAAVVVAAIAAAILLSRGSETADRDTRSPASSPARSRITHLPTTEAPTTTLPPQTPDAFAGLLDGNRIVVAASDDGRVLRTVYTHRGPHEVDDVLFDRVNSNVYFTTSDTATGTVWRISVDGGEPTRLFPGCGIQLSPDGKDAAVIGGPNGCRDGITVHNLASDTERRYARGTAGDAVADVAWTKNGKGEQALVLLAMDDAGATTLHRLDLESDRTLDDAERIGPPQGGAPGVWLSPEHMPTTGLVKLVVYCCARDAEPVESDTSDVVVIDAAGKEVDRWRTPEDVEAVAVASNGSSAELYLGMRGELYRRTGDSLRKLPGTWRFIDW